MSRKRILIIFVFIILFNVTNVRVLAADEKPSSWAEKEVTAAITAKLVPQTLQSKYTQPTTRAEFCALAVTLYEKVKGKAITERKTFADTKDENVEKAGGIGIAIALGDNKFYPGAKITREHVAIMTARLTNALGKPLPKKAATYDDKSSISASALESVGQVQAVGLMVEVGGKKFAPKELYTREQSIVTIMRTYEAMKVGGTTEPPKPTEWPTSGATSIVGTWMYSSAGFDDTFYQDSCKSGSFAYTPGVKYPRNARLFVFRADGTGTRVLITESAISSAQFTYTSSSSEITMSITSNTNHHSDGSLNTEQYNPPNTRTERYKISVGEDGQTYMAMTLLDNWLSNHFYKIQ